MTGSLDQYVPKGGSPSSDVNLNRTSVSGSLDGKLLYVLFGRSCRNGANGIGLVRFARHRLDGESVPTRHLAGKLPSLEAFLRGVCESIGSGDNLTRDGSGSRFTGGTHFAPRIIQTILFVKIPTRFVCYEQALAFGVTSMSGNYEILD